MFTRYCVFFQTELQEMASKADSTVYESTPSARPEDVVAGAESSVTDYQNLSGAKSIREKFADPSKLEHEVKKTVWL